MIIWGAKSSAKSSTCIDVLSTAAGGAKMPLTCSGVFKNMWGWSFHDLNGNVYGNKKQNWCEVSENTIGL